MEKIEVEKAKEIYLKAKDLYLTGEVKCISDGVRQLVASMRENKTRSPNMGGEKNG